MTKKPPTTPQIESLPVEALIPYARNSRTHSEEQVAQIAGSIAEFGFTNPVLIGADNDIIAGHGRVLAARKLGLVEVPCIRLGYLTEAQKRAYVIADNKLALNAGWDEGLLISELQAVMESGIEIDKIGFTEADLDALAASLDVDDETANEAKPEKLPKAIQLEPTREYCVVLCADDEEWEALKVVFNLQPVRRGGYKAGSPFESVGTQRVIHARNILKRFTQNANSDSE
jgi:ParB-like chromosome segregation protein Spo0J